MNSKSLLNIINVIIKNDKNFSESPDEIYSLFKKHGYEGDIETLKLDLRNLLDDVIKSDEELSKVAGGKVSKLAAGAVAALTCLPMNSFASGITDAIKSGAKKVGDATNEYVIKPVKNAANTIAKNPGKSAAVTTAIVLSDLLSVLVGKHLASPPKPDTQGMTGAEKQKVEETYKVLSELAEEFYVEIEDNVYSWDLNKLKTKPAGLSDGKIKIGNLVEKLMPEKIGLEQPTTDYTRTRKEYIAYEKALIKMLEKSQQELETKRTEELNNLKKEQEDLQQKLKENEDKIEKQKKEHEEELKTKEEEIAKQKKNYEQQLEQKDEKIIKLDPENVKQLTKKIDELKQQNELKQQTIEKMHETNTQTLDNDAKKLKEKEDQIEGLKFDNLNLTNEKEDLVQKNKNLNDDIDDYQKQIAKLTQTLDAQNKNRTMQPGEALLTGYNDKSKINVLVAAALAKNYKLDLESLKATIRNGGSAAYNEFRNLSNILRETENRPEIPIGWKGFKGSFSLAEILLKPDNTLPQMLRNESDLKNVEIANFNLEANDYKSKEDLRTSARNLQTWLKWLKPYAGRLNYYKYGIYNDSVVKQLPELIVATCTLNQQYPLINLLTALETHLAADTFSECREKVNAALEKVGIRFDDKACALVSAI